jgi:hypothetical protein
MTFLRFLNLSSVGMSTMKRATIGKVHNSIISDRATWNSLYLYLKKGR